MAKKKLLLVGESWVSTANHVKGWDAFSSVTFHLGAEPLVKALADSPFELTYMKAHDAATDFPSSLKGLQQYDAILLSDIGSNTLLLHPDVWLNGNTVPNRLKLIRDYAEAGGGLMVAVIQLAIALGSTAGGIAFDRYSWQSTFALSGIVLLFAAALTFLLSRLHK